LLDVKIFFYFLWRFDPTSVHVLPFWGFAVSLIGHNTVCRSTLDEWSAPHRWLYLIAHNIHKHPCPGGIPTVQRRQTHTLDHAAT